MQISIVYYIPMDLWSGRTQPPCLINFKTQYWSKHIFEIHSIYNQCVTGVNLKISIVNHNDQK